MKSAIRAILWETWRVTRVEVAWKLALGTAGGMAVLAVFSGQPAGITDLSAAIALILIVLPHLVGWLSLAKLNGGRPGFPLYVLYTRPVRTSVLVAVPMAYLAAVSSAIYLVSAFLLRVASGYAFPLLPVAAWIAALTLVVLAAAWSTRNGIIQVMVMAYAVTRGLKLAMDRLTAVEIQGSFDWPPRLWPALFDFPLTDYAVIGAIGLASFAVTVAGVARLRHGGGAAVPPAQPGGPWDRLVSLFRFPCPTSSATRAQIWLDLKSNGLPVLAIGVTLALVILLVSAVAGPVDAAFSDEIRAHLSCSNRDCFYVRAMPVLFAPLSLLIVLLLGGNAFGIRRRQGRTYLSAFETTQAYGTAQLAALKLLVKSVCLLASLIAVGVSIWTSISLLGDPVFIQMLNVPMSSRLTAIQNAAAALTGYEQLALAVVAAVGVALWVAAFAVLGALWTRYSRRANIAASSLLLSGLALGLLALAERNGIVPPFAAAAIFAAARWIFLSAIVFTTVYVFWSGFAERVLTIRYTNAAVAISAAFAMAWVTSLRVAGVHLGAIPTMDAVWMLSPALLPLMAGILAPWSLNRIRHI